MPSRASPQGHPGGSSRPSDIATSYYGAGLHNARASNNPQTVYESNAHVVRESNNARAMYEGSSNVRAMYDNNGRAMYENNARNMYDNNSIAVYARGNRVVYGTNQQHHNNHNNNNNNHPPGGTLRGGGPPGTIYGTHPRGNFDLGSSFECVSTYDMSNQNVLGTAAQAPYIVAPPSAYIAGNQNTLGLSSHYNANRAIANAHSTGAPLLNALPGPAPHPNNAHAGAQQSKSPYIATQGRSNTFDSTTGSDSKQDSIPRFRIPPGARLSHSYKRRRSSCPFAFHYTPQPSVHRTRSVMEDGLSVSSGSAASGAGGSSLGGDEVVLRINVPELKVEKCLQFHKDDLVWDVKQQALAALPKVALWYRELRESFN